jgi:hypothetical protein
MSALSGMINKDARKKMALEMGEREDDVRNRAWATLGAAVGILAAGYGVALAIGTNVDHSSGPKVGAGLNALSLLFVLALAIERVVQPFAGFLGPDSAASKAEKVSKPKDAAGRSAADAVAAAAKLAAASNMRGSMADPRLTARDVVDKEAQAMAMMVATKAEDEARSWNAIKTDDQMTAKISDDRNKTALVTWAAATGLASLSAVGLNITLFAVVLNPSGAQSPYWLDLLITGLAVGAGTKPLNDLWTALQGR